MNAQRCMVHEMLIASYLLHSERPNLRSELRVQLDRTIVYPLHISILRLGLCYDTTVSTVFFSIFVLGVQNSLSLCMPLPPPRCIEGPARSALRAFSVELGHVSES